MTTTKNATPDTEEGGVQLRTVDAEDAEMRLDRWFKRHYPTLAHGRLEKLLRTGQVRVEGKRAKAGQKLESGQTVRLPPQVTAAPSEAPAPAKAASAALNPADVALIQSCVLHRDDHIIVLNKPPGLAVQGGTGTTRHVDGLLEALRFGAAERPRLVHRLDKDTSGLLVLGRTRAAAAALTRAFRSRETRKLYWALVVGVPPQREGVVRAPLSKAPGAVEKMVVDTESGQSAFTDFRVVESAAKVVAWLALEPRTGRTHQLRVHCAVLGTPILGDGKYGGAEAQLQGQGISRKMHLHARALSLPHPAGGTFAIAAPLPPHMAESFAFFGFDEPSASGDPFAEATCGPEGCG